MNLEGRRRKYPFSMFMYYLDIQHVDSEETHNKDSQYSRSVGRERNIGPSTTKQYQFDRRYWCEKSL